MQKESLLSERSEFQTFQDFLLTFLSIEKSKSPSGLRTSS